MQSNTFDITADPTTTESQSINYPFDGRIKYIMFYFPYGTHGKIGFRLVMNDKYVFPSDGSYLSLDGVSQVINFIYGFSAGSVLKCEVKNTSTTKLRVVVNVVSGEIETK